MKVEPRFRIGPFQVSGGAGCTWVIILVVLLCLCGGAIAQLSQR